MCIVKPVNITVSQICQTYLDMRRNFSIISQRRFDKIHIMCSYCCCLSLVTNGVMKFCLEKEKKWWIYIFKNIWHEQNFPLFFKNWGKQFFALISEKTKTKKKKSTLVVSNVKLLFDYYKVHHKTNIHYRQGVFFFFTLKF